MSIEHTDREAAKVAVAPRVSLKDIEDNIAEQYFFIARDIIDAAGFKTRSRSLDVLTICILVMRNGFTVIGKSVPASKANFDPALGTKFAYEDAVRQLWPVMGYALLDKLAGN